MDIKEFMKSEEGQAIARQIGDQMQAYQKREQDKKRKNFAILNDYLPKGAIIFTGSSLMEQFPVSEIALSRGITKPIFNRGIGGTTTDDFLAAVDIVTAASRKPSKIFVNIGTNDMTDRIYGDKWMDHLEENYDKILAFIKDKSPETEVYTMAYYPTNRSLPGARENPWQWGMLKDRSPENIQECDRRVEALAKKYGYHYIDVNDGLYDENGEQNAKFAIDGVHMYASAYEIIFDNIVKYI